MLCPGVFWTCLGTECQRKMHAKHQVEQSRSSSERLQHSRAFPSPWQRTLLEVRENPELETMLPEENKPHRKRFPIPWQSKEQKEYLSNKQTKKTINNNMRKLSHFRMLTLGLYTSFTLPMSTVYVGEEKLPQMNFKGSGISQLFEICNKGKCCKTRCQ